MLVILSAFVFFSIMGNGSIWVDEAFTLELMHHSYAEIIEITAADVHPPLYYLLLKIIYDSICKLFPNINIIVALKLFEFFGFVVVIGFVAEQFKKELKENVNLWLLCILGLPLILHYSYEIRMYGLAMIFVMLAYVFFRRILLDDYRKDYSLFIIMSLGASYTHYYACIAVMPLFILLLIRNIITKRSITKWLNYTGLAVLVYIPWLFVLISTMCRVKESFHIPALTWRTVCGYWMIIFNPEFSDKHFNYFVITIFTIILLHMCFINYKHKADSSIENIFCSMAGIIMLVWVIFIGTFVSIIYKPLFATRYEVIVLPCFWLSFNILLMKEKKFIRFMATALLIIFSIIGLLNNCKKEIDYKQSLNILLDSFEWSSDFNENNKIITEYGNDASVTISANSHLNRTLSCLLECECYLWMNEETELSKRVYQRIFSLYSEETIISWLENGKKIWFVGYDENMVFENINLVYVGHFQLEDYEFNLYKCSF